MDRIAPRRLRPAPHLLALTQVAVSAREMWTTFDMNAIGFGIGLMLCNALVLAAVTQQLHNGGALLLPDFTRFRAPGPGSRRFVHVPFVCASVPCDGAGARPGGGRGGGGPGGGLSGSGGQSKRLLAVGTSGEGAEGLGMALASVQIAFSPNNADSAGAEPPSAAIFGGRTGRLVLCWRPPGICRVCCCARALALPYHRFPLGRGGGGGSGIAERLAGGWGAVRSGGHGTDCPPEALAEFCTL